MSTFNVVATKLMKHQKIFHLDEAVARQAMTNLPVLCYNLEYDLYFFLYENEIYEYACVFASLFCGGSTKVTKRLHKELPVEIDLLLHTSMLRADIYGIDLTDAEKFTLFEKKNAVDCPLIHENL